MRTTLAILVLVLAADTARATHDVGVSAIVRPETVEAVICHWPEMMVHNFGNAPESNIPVRCCIDSAGVRIYNYQRAFGGSIPPGAESLHWIYTFNPGAEFFYYDMTVFTELTNDEDRSNDTMRRRFYWSRAEIADSMVLMEWTGARVNGVIEPHEYGSGQDISDYIGRTGARRPLASCIAVGGFRFDTVFVGVNVRALPDRQDGDRVVLFVDDDGDGRWASDSSEGMFEIRVCGDADSVSWRPMPGGASRRAEGCYAASSIAGGNLQFEAALSNIGLVRWGRSLAAWSLWRGDSCWGWWPSSLPLAQWEDPGQYGPIVWVSMAVQELADLGLTCPNRTTMVRGVLWLDPATMNERQTACLIDAAGRAARQLHPGWNDLTAVRPGVYFVLMPASGARPNRKVLLTGE